MQCNSIFIKNKYKYAGFAWVFAFCILTLDSMASTDEQEGACSKAFNIITIINQESVIQAEKLRPYLGEWSSTPTTLGIGQKCCANPPAYINGRNQKITMGDILVYGDGTSGLYGKVVDALRNNDGEVVLVVLFIDRSKKLLLTSISGERRPDIYLANEHKQHFENLIEDLMGHSIFAKPIMGSGFSLFSSLHHVVISKSLEKHNYEVGDWITFKEFSDGKSINRLARISRIFSSGIDNSEIVAKQMRSDGRIVSVLLSKSNIKSMKRLHPQPSGNLNEELVFRSISKHELILRAGVIGGPSTPIYVSGGLIEGRSDPQHVIKMENGDKVILGTIENLDLHQAWNQSGELKSTEFEFDNDVISTFANGRIELSNGTILNLFDAGVLENIYGIHSGAAVFAEDATLLSPRDLSENKNSFPKGNIRAVNLMIPDSLLEGASNLLVSSHIAAVQLAKHKSQGEGNFEMWVMRYPELMRDLGFGTETDGVVVYPDINGLNYRFSRHSVFKQTAQHITLKSKLSYIRDEAEYIEYWNNSLARGEFLVSSDGSQHFREMGVIPSLVLLPPDYVADMVKAARLLEGLKSSFPGAEHITAIRSSMKLLRDKLFRTLDLVEDIVFFDSISRVRVLESALDISPIFSNENLLKIFDQSKSTMLHNDLKKNDLLSLYAKITGISLKDAEQKLGLETARSLQKLKFQLRYNTQVISQLLSERSIK